MLFCYIRVKVICLQNFPVFVPCFKTPTSTLLMIILHELLYALPFRFQTDILYFSVPDNMTEQFHKLKILPISQDFPQSHLKCELKRYNY